MAKVIGDTSRLNLGEQRVLEWVASSRLKNQFHVLIEPSYKANKFKRARWPDFVLISKKFGVIILECKSHSENNILKVNETQGIVLNGEVDRYQIQLRDYFYLVKNLTKDLKWDVPIKLGAVFPFVSKFHPAARAIEEHHYDDSGVLLFKEDLLEKFDLSNEDEVLTTEQFHELCRALNKESVIEHNYGLDQREIKKRILRFSEEQLEKINRVQDGNYIFHGLPGTGKTKMLTAIARREADKGKRIGFVCFNRPLRDAVAEELSEDIVFTTSMIFYRLCKEFNLPFDFKRPDLMEKSREIILAKKFEPLFEVLLVDEYQDLDEADYQLLRKCIAPGGLIVLAGDPLQEIRGKEVTWKSRGIEVHGRQSMFLARPYRTESSIVDFGLSFLQTNKTLKNAVDKYFFDHRHVYTFHGSRDGVRDNIHFWLYNKTELNSMIRKVVAENPNSEILIVTNFKEQKEHLDIPRSQRIKIEPYSRVKGLEGDIVILYNLDFYLESKSQATKEAKMRSLFSALCRSRGKIIIHGYQNKDFYTDLLKLSQEYTNESSFKKLGKFFKLIG